MGDLFFIIGLISFVAIVVVATALFTYMETKNKKSPPRNPSTAPRD